MAFFRKLIEVAVVFLLVASPVFAQTEDHEQQRKEELIEQLLDPAAIKRAKAAVELRDKLTEKELRRWLDGYKERYREDGEIRERTIPPDLLRLTVALSAWPTAADEILEDLYKVDDESYGLAIAGCIYDHRKFKYIATDSDIGSYVRDWWFKDWWKRIPEQYLTWPDVVEKIVYEDWIYDKWLEKEHRWDHLAVVKIMRGEELELDPGFPWIETFKECWEAQDYKIPATFGDKVKELGAFYTNNLDTITYADVICILMRRYHWFEKHREFLRTFKFEWFGHDCTKVHPITEIYSYMMHSEYDKVKKLLEDYALDQMSWGYYYVFKPWTILHHPMFARLREQDWFKDWWKEWFHAIEIVEPDPSFEVYPEDRDE